MALRLFSAAAVATVIAGCASVRPVTRPDHFISARHPKQLWVTQVDGKQWWLVNPRVEGDQVVGWARCRQEREVTVPLADAQLVEAKQMDHGRTALAAGFALVAGGMFLHYVTRATSASVGRCDPNNPFGNSADCY